MTQTKRSGNYNHYFQFLEEEWLDLLIKKNNEYLFLPVAGKIYKINSNINIHLGKYEPINLDKFEKDKKYLVFSGIGNHQTFVSMIKKNGLEVLKDLEFSDHYPYTRQDIDKILNEASSLNCEIITTEKDFLRLNNFNLSGIKTMKAELKIMDEDKLIESII